MDIRIKATDYEITPETRKYLDERIAHIEKLLSGDADNARLEIELGRAAGRPRHGANIWFTEVQILYGSGKKIRASNNSESINGAIDDVRNEVERQLLKEKKLHKRIIHKGGEAVKRMIRFGKEE
jgi:ribosomal subunit interface protein